ncbi:MAG: (2Fe-2S) ferredoxin domain-containing protein [Deltaproteobacteria bacterium]|nr:MAG: (2Fe-2S) ferredoxin domain-containing protein [Deltaproteobacteria bacterium]
MAKPEHHIFVCSSFRGTEAKGKCIKKGTLNLVSYIEEEITDRGLDAMVSTTGCLKLCDEGPILIIYPQGYWYKSVDSEEIVDEILDALEKGEQCAEYRMY